MSVPLYTRIEQEVARFVDPKVDESSVERLALLVTGIIGSESVSPARIARALKALGLSEASAESIERRVRRIENDPQITSALCFHRLARQRLRCGRPQRLHLVIDPTTQDDRLVMLTVSVQYRGRALPLVWAIWPGNQLLTGDRFWARVAALLDQVAALLPQGVPVVWLADRAFGTPAFCDLVTAHGWDYVVRVQGQARCRDRLGVSVRFASSFNANGSAASCGGRCSRSAAGGQPLCWSTGAGGTLPRSVWSPAWAPTGRDWPSTGSATPLKPFSVTASVPVGSGNTTR
jgi:hypothetical protein